MRHGKHAVLSATANRDEAEFSYSVKWSIGGEVKHTCGTADETTSCEVEDLKFKFSTAAALNPGVTTYTAEWDVVETTTSCSADLGVLGLYLRHTTACILIAVLQQVSQSESRDSSTQLLIGLFLEDSY